MLAAGIASSAPPKTSSKTKANETPCLENLPACLTFPPCSKKQPNRIDHENVVHFSFMPVREPRAPIRNVFQGPGPKASAACPAVAGAGS